jgi:hypothetical protein
LLASAFAPLGNFKAGSVANTTEYKDVINNKAKINDNFFIANSFRRF